MRGSLTDFRTVRVKRTALRQNQRQTLKRAKGSTVVVITSNDEEDEKLLLDKAYFDKLVGNLASLAETLEITADQKLFSQILRAASTLEQDTRRGKLHTFEEAFGEE